MANILNDTRIEIRLYSIDDYKEGIQEHRNSIFDMRERIIRDLDQAEDVRQILNVLSYGVRYVEEQQMYIDYNQRKIIQTYSDIMDVIGEN